MLTYFVFTAVDCPALTVAHSNTASVAGSTTDTVLVTCESGYSSDDNLNFTASCDGTGPGVSEWSAQTCDGM